MKGIFPETRQFPARSVKTCSSINGNARKAQSNLKYLNPADANMASDGDYDPLYGSSIYTVASPDNSGQFSVFSDNGSFVYDMRELIDPAIAASISAYGCPDLGLQTMPGLMGGAAITMDHPVTLSLDARIREADVACAPGTTDQAFAATNPLGTAGIGIVVTFGSANLHVTLFLQAELANSRFNTTPIAYQNSNFDAYNASFIYNDVNASNAELSYVAGDTPEQIKWNINAILVDAIKNVPSLSDNAAELDNLAVWHFNDTYIGLEMAASMHRRLKATPFWICNCLISTFSMILPQPTTHQPRRPRAMP